MIINPPSPVNLQQQKLTARRKPMPIKPPVDPRAKEAEREVLQLIGEFPGELDFYDVVHRVDKRGKVYRMEAKCALVHLINTGVLEESANRKISIAQRARDK